MLSFAVASSTVEVSLSLLRPCRLPKLPLRVAAALAFSAVVIYPTRASDFRGCIFPGWPRCCNVGLPFDQDALPECSRSRRVRRRG
nr:hypothetical protein Itr_chr11CG16390 [Ipomoea trifida]